MILSSMPTGASENITTPSPAVAGLATGIYFLIQLYIVPMLAALAIINNITIIFLCLTNRNFKKSTAPPILKYYLAFAIADILSVLNYNLVTWLGKKRFFICKVYVRCHK